MEREEWLDSTDPRHAAAAWHALMQSDELDESKQGKFADWLCKSPTHVAEYLQLIGVRDRLRDPAMFEGMSLEVLQRQIGSNVENLPFPVPSSPGTSASKRARKWALPVALAAGVLLSLAFLLTNYLHKELAHRYVTGIGEQRSVVLPDGSIAELNTQSAVQVRFTEAGRDIVLEKGAEAWFRVAKDAQRPFRVRSGETIVQAIGTEFTVRREADRTTVTVLDGRVRVASVELGKGQRLALDVNKPGAAAPIESVTPEVALAWKTRRLVFDDLPLEAVIAEFNRYNERQIDLASVPSGLRRITGVFNANDPDSFRQFLRQSQGQPVASPHQGTQNH